MKADDLPGVIRLVHEGHQLFVLWAAQPFELVDEPAIAEHRDLETVFSSCLRLLNELVGHAMAAFRAGQVEFAVPEAILELRKQLGRQAEGTSPTARLLSRHIRRRQSEHVQENDGKPVDPPV